MVEVIPALTAAHLESLERSPGRSESGQIDLCDQEINPHACAYFVTRFCRVTDEGIDALIPAWEFVLEDCAAFQRGDDVHDEKTRQMLATWLTLAQHLWRMTSVRKVSGFLMSRKEKLVDDGGDKATTHSMFGRLRHLYNNLPQYMRDRAEVEFSKLRATCERTGSFVTGDGTTDDPGRGNTIGRADADEAARIPGSKWYAALRRACPHGLRMRSTPDGKANKFWQVKYETRGNFTFLRKHWTRHPDRWDGQEFDENGKPTSAWYRSVCADMTKDEIAREVDISYEHSVSGQVLPEYDEDVHLTTEAVFDPELPFYASMDFGGGAATTCLFSQVHGKEWWWLGDYESWNGDVDDHAPAIWAKAQELGFRGERKQIRFFGDPAGNARELTNKNSTVIRAYRGHGFNNFSAAPRKSVADRIRLMRRKFKRREVFIHVGCNNVRKRITDYRYRTDDMGHVLGDVILDNASVHMMDGCGYGAISLYPIDEASSPIYRTPEPLVAPVPLGRELSRYDERDAFRPIMSGKRDF